MEPFVVLFTCVDHRSRSVLAERLLRHRADQAGYDHLEVVGAGGHKTHPTPGLHRYTEAQLVRLGLDASPAASRQLTTAQVMTADLLLTFEREHRTEVFQFAPRMLTHCFALTELVAISRAAPDLLEVPLSERIVRASRLRHLAAGAPDVPDTWRQSEEAHQAAADLIDSSITALLPFLVAEP